MFNRTIRLRDINNAATELAAMQISEHTLTEPQESLTSSIDFKQHLLHFIIIIITLLITVDYTVLIT